LGFRYVQTDIGYCHMMESKFWEKRSKNDALLIGQKISKINNWKRNHPDEKYSSQKHHEEIFGELPLCKCGCGHKVKKCNNNYLHGHNKPWKNKKRGPIPYEQKIKMSKSHLGKKYNVSEAGREQKRINIKKTHTPEAIQKNLHNRSMTSLEILFQKIVDKNKLAYQYVGNGSFIVDHMIPDFVNTNGEKIAIEVYTKFFKKRNGKSIASWKRKRNKQFAKYGWKIIYFDETQVNESFVLRTLNKQGGDYNFKL
jgi:hypothetical protein